MALDRFFVVDIQTHHFNFRVLNSVQFVIVVVVEGNPLMREKYWASKNSAV
jgi:hypothetical protein